MERQEVINDLVIQDIDDITQAIYQNDFEFLTNVLTGNGFTGYNNLTNRELEIEYNERLLPDDSEPIKII